MSVDFFSLEILARQGLRAMFAKEAISCEELTEALLCLRELANEEYV